MQILTSVFVRFSWINVVYKLCYIIKRTEKTIVEIKNKEIGLALFPEFFLPNDGGA